MSPTQVDEPNDAVACQLYKVTLADARAYQNYLSTLAHAQSVSSHSYSDQPWAGYALARGQRPDNSPCIPKYLSTVQPLRTQCSQAIRTSWFTLLDAHWKAHEVITPRLDTVQILLWLSIRLARTPTITMPNTPDCLHPLAPHSGQAVMSAGLSCQG